MEKLKERVEFELIAFLGDLVPNFFGEEHWVYDDWCWCFCAGNIEGHEFTGKDCLFKDIGWDRNSFICEDCRKPCGIAYGREGFPYECGSELGYYSYSVTRSDCCKDGVFNYNGIEKV